MSSSSLPAGSIVGALNHKLYTQSSAPEDWRNYCPKHVELTGIINKPLLSHLVCCSYHCFGYKLKNSRCRLIWSRCRMCCLYLWCTSLPKCHHTAKESGIARIFSVTYKQIPYKGAKLILRKITTNWYWTSVR